MIDRCLFIARILALAGLLVACSGVRAAEIRLPYLATTGVLMNLLDPGDGSAPWELAP